MLGWLPTFCAAALSIWATSDALAPPPAASTSMGGAPLAMLLAMGLAILWPGSVLLHALSGRLQFGGLAVVQTLLGLSVGLGGALRLADVLGAGVAVTLAAAALASGAASYLFAFLRERAAEVRREPHLLRLARPRADGHRKRRSPAGAGARPPLGAPRRRGGRPRPDVRAGDPAAAGIRLRTRRSRRLGSSRSFGAGLRGRARPSCAALPGRARHPRRDHRCRSPSAGRASGRRFLPRARRDAFCARSASEASPSSFSTVRPRRF